MFHEKEFKTMKPTYNLYSQTTRRRVLTGIAGILSFSTAPAFMKKSMISGRNTVLTEEIPPDKPTAADYIQEGLVAMWDGIENAGWGLHDYDATVWVDLIGGNNMSFIGDCSFGDDYCHFQSSTSYSNAPLTSEMLSLLSSGYSDQCVVVEHAIFSTGSANGIFAINKCGLNVRGTSLSIIQPVRPSGTGSYIYHTLSTGAYSIMADNSSSLIYENSEIISSQAGYIISQASSSNGFTVNRRENFYQYGLGSLKVGCRRVYTRVLSTDEIAYNCKIDKLRFNLP